MKKELINKIRVGLVFSLISIQFIGLLFSIFGFGDVGQRILFFDNYLHTNWREVGHSELTSGYPINEFLKDSYVNTCLYRDGILICIIVTALFLITYIIFGLLFKQGGNTAQLKQNRMS